MKKLLPLAGVIAVPVLLAVAGGALTSDDAPPNISNEPAVTDRELPRAPLSDGQGDDRDAADGRDGTGRDGAGRDGGTSGGAPAPAQPAPNLNYQPAPNYGDWDDDDWDDDDWDDDDWDDDYDDDWDDD